jgi:hypothetical protein
LAAAIEAQIDCDDASDDFIKEKLHSNIRSSSTDSMTRPSYSSIDVSPQRPCGFMDDNRGSFADMSLKIKRVSQREPCGTSGRATTAYRGPGKAREPVWWAGVDHGDNPEPGCVHHVRPVAEHLVVGDHFAVVATPVQRHVEREGQKPHGSRCSSMRPVNQGYFENPSQRAHAGRNRNTASGKCAASHVAIASCLR